MVVRDIDELIVINGEAHHIHEEMRGSNLFIDIDNKLKQKGGWSFFQQMLPLLQRTTKAQSLFR